MKWRKQKQETRGRIKTGKQEKRAKPIFGLHVSWQVLIPSMQLAFKYLLCNVITGCTYSS